MCVPPNPSESDLFVVLDEEEEHHILPEMLNSQVEWEGGVCLEHVIQQRSTELRKVAGVQVVLQEIRRAFHLTQITFKALERDLLPIQLS